MSGKSVRNLIFALVILIVGVQLIVFVLKAYIPVTTVNIDILNLNVLSDLANGFSIAIGVIIILLIPVYIYKRSKNDEKIKQ